VTKEEKAWLLAALERAMSTALTSQLRRKKKLLSGEQLFCKLFPEGLSLVAVNIPVENREADEEGHADQVFHPFDVLIVVDQRDDFLDFSYGCE
jgi:hypothetical protein